ncbi:YlxR family protein [Demequina sp.]|uniref:YlxR family protein n=1 Tax=Demequina sp. TaxID=2050685 RepID=UPI003D0C2651
MVEPSTSSRNPTASHLGPQGPVRTCIGCRERAARSDLVRVAVVDGEVVIDEHATLPGRGAWLHRRPECLELAKRRKAFSRALRAGVADASSLSFG